MGTKRLFNVMQSLTNIMVMCYLVNFATGTNVAYVIGKLQGCVTVKNEPICRINYSVPDYFAKQYNHSLKIIQRILPKNGSSSNGCKETFRKLFCGQTFPRCVIPNKFNFGNATSLCARLLLVCSKQQDLFIRIFAKLNLCKLAQNGLFDSDRCIDFSTTKFGNSCAKRLEKVPIWIADRYSKKQQVTKNNTKNKLPNPKLISCKKTVPNTLCKIPFCSSNKMYILTTYTKQKCMAESKCLFGNSLAGNDIKMMCNSHPDETKAKKIYVV